MASTDHIYANEDDMHQHYEAVPDAVEPTYSVVVKATKVQQEMTSSENITEQRSRASSRSSDDSDKDHVYEEPAPVSGDGARHLRQEADEHSTGHFRVEAEFAGERRSVSNISIKSSSASERSAVSLHRTAERIEDNIYANIEEVRRGSRSSSDSDVHQHHDTDTHGGTEVTAEYRHDDDETQLYVDAESVRATRDERHQHVSIEATRQEEHHQHVSIEAVKVSEVNNNMTDYHKTATIQLSVETKTEVHVNTLDTKEQRKDLSPNQSSGTFVLRSSRPSGAALFIQHVREMASKNTFPAETAELEHDEPRTDAERAADAEAIRLAAEKEREHHITVVKSDQRTTTTPDGIKRKQSQITASLVQQFERSTSASDVIPSPTTPIAASQNKWNDPVKHGSESTIATRSDLDNGQEETALLNSDVSKQRVQLRQKGSLANRRKPSRSSLRSNSTEDADVFDGERGHGEHEDVVLSDQKVHVVTAENHATTLSNGHEKVVNVDVTVTSTTVKNDVHTANKHVTPSTKSSSTVQQSVLVKAASTTPRPVMLTIATPELTTIQPVSSTSPVPQPQHNVVLPVTPASSELVKVLLSPKAKDEGYKLPPAWMSEVETRRKSKSYIVAHTPEQPLRLGETPQWKKDLAEKTKNRRASNDIADVADIPLSPSTGTPGQTPSSVPPFVIEMEARKRKQTRSSITGVEDAS